MLRLVFVLLWSVSYFYLSKVGIARIWERVNIFSFRQWKGLISTWRSGEWVVDTPSEYALCTVMVLWIPVWLLGVYLICHFLRPKITPKVIQQATAAHPFIPAYTPVAMPSQGKSAVLSEPPSAVESDQPAQNNEQTEWVPKDNSEAEALDLITKIAEENNLTPFPHVLLENELIPITISSDVDACLIKVLATEGMWQVAMTEPLEQSVWSNNTQTKTVLKEIVLGKGILSKMEPESNVIPVVVLAKGGIANKEMVIPWLSQRGIEVVTLPGNPQEGLLELQDVLNKYFVQSENQEEVNEMDQVAVS